MNKSLYTKLVSIMLVLILSIMAVVGAFLMRGVRSYFLSDFYGQMQSVFSRADLAADLRSAANGDDAAAHMMEILRAYSGELGIGSGSRNCYILSDTGEALAGSSRTSRTSVSMTPNILTAISGAEGYLSDVGADYMDVALPISGSEGSFIVYVIDNKNTVTALNDQLFRIVMESIIF